MADTSGSAAPVEQGVWKCGRNIVKNLLARKCGNESFFNLQQSFLKNRIFQLSMSQCVDFERPFTSTINAMDVDRNGRYLLTGCKDGSLNIHDLYNFSGKRVYQSQAVEGASIVETSYTVTSSSVDTVQWYPFDHGMILTSGMDKTLRIWDSNEMKPITAFTFPQKIYQHHISPVPIRNKPLVAVASGLPGVRLVDLRTGNYCQELRGHLGCVYCCRWSPLDANVLATGSWDSTIRLWDIRASSSCFAVLDKDSGEVNLKACSPMVTSHDGSVNGINFVPDGSRLISLGSDCRVRCWDLYTRKHLNIPYKRIQVRKTRAIDFAVCGSRNEHFCFIPNQCKIVILTLETGEEVKTLCGHFGRINTCYFHQERMELYSAGHDRNILMWTSESELEEEERVDHVPTRLDNWDGD